VTARIALKAAVLGFVATILCYFALFLLFTGVAPDAAAFYVIVAIVCPPLAIDRLAEPGWTMAVLPFLNAALYAAIAWLILALWDRRLQRTR
jgi:hypothetical protein